MTVVGTGRQRNHRAQVSVIRLSKELRSHEAKRPYPMQRSYQIRVDLFPRAWLRRRGLIGVALWERVSSEARTGSPSLERREW